MILLNGLRALVTGGSRGIGRATALILARAGADVFIGYHRREQDARDVVSSIEALGVRAGAHLADIRSREGVESLFDAAIGALGGLDIVVGNAGTWPADEVHVADMPEERWRDTMTANLDSAFHTARLAARHVGSGGRIVLVTSTAAQRGEALHADYAASKGAVVSLVKSMAAELGPRDITVNSVAPGWVDTEMSVSALGGAQRESIEQAIPLRRVAAPEDVAGPILFLCSPLARHVTGEILNVNGGSVLCG